MDGRVACLQRGLPKNHDSGPRLPGVAQRRAKRRGRVRHSGHTGPEQGVQKGESSRDGNDRQAGDAVRRYR